jgi:hypothetical protein
MGNSLRAITFAVALALSSLAAQAAVVTGLDTSTSYGLYNGLYQWEFGATAISPETRLLGKVNLGVGGVFDYNIRGGDVAALSDSRIAITHKDVDNTKWQISVLTPQYDGSGLLVDATVDATFDADIQASRIAPLPDGGFAIAKTGNAVVYEKTGVNTWSGTLISGLNASSVYDVVGLITLSATNSEPQIMTGEYVTPPGGSAARSGQKYDTTGKLAKYYDPNTMRGWGYGKHGEGLRNDLLANGWIISGEPILDSSQHKIGTNIGSVIFDGVEEDGAWHAVKIGEILQADGSSITTDSYTIHDWAALSDGRVVNVWASGYGRNDADFNVYTLIENPALQPAGSIGATGEDYRVTLGSASSGSKDNFVGEVCGDYMVVPEPATMSLLGLGLVGLLRLRRRR